MGLGTKNAKLHRVCGSRRTGTRVYAFAIPSTLLAGRYADRATGARPVVGQRSPTASRNANSPLNAAILLLFDYRKCRPKGATVNPALSRRLTGLEQGSL